MLEAINNQCKLMNIQPHPYFVDKIIQLYEMTIVRHGLMVVGDPFSGKSSAMNVLAGALTELNEKGLMDERKTIINRLNPKSVTMGQLYGKADEVSHDWQDGVLAVLYRNMANNMSVEDKRWLVFDGPVDAVWIENMNTVLDDNKKLCLMSGEIIQMTDNMNMVFEPMDLQEASPATVSRCGMIYMQPHLIGWRPLYDSWKNTLPEFFQTTGEEDQGNPFMANVDELTDIVVDPIIAFIRKECRETSGTNNQAIVQALLRLWGTLLKKFSEQSFTAELDKRQATAVIDNMFLFSVIWSLCITCDTEYRRPIDGYLKKLCDGSVENLPKFSNNKKLLPTSFDRGLIYDYLYDPEKNEWRHWMADIDKDSIDKFPREMPVQEIVVTTVDTVRYSYIQRFCILNNIPTLFVGPTGTGKSVYI